MYYESSACYGSSVKVLEHTTYLDIIPVSGGFIFHFMFQLVLNCGNPKPGISLFDAPAANIHCMTPA